MPTDKLSLRKHITALKKNYSSQQLLSWSQLIGQQVEALPEFQQAQTLLLYYSMPGEVHTHSMLQNWSQQKQCYLPKVTKEGLELRLYEGEDKLQGGQMNLLEPTGPLLPNYSQLDLVLVPGLAFDREGRRLGYGKAYYDRLLTQIQAPLVALCYQFQVVEQVPTEAHDISMHKIITENELILP